MYQKEIIYMSLYDKETKQDCVGYLKQETKQGQCQLEVQVKKIPQAFTGSFPIRLQNETGWQEIGMLVVKDGQGKWRGNLANPLLKAEILLSGTMKIKGESKNSETLAGKEKTAQGRVAVKEAAEGKAWEAEKAREEKTSQSEKKRRPSWESGGNRNEENTQRDRAQRIEEENVRKDTIQRAKEEKAWKDTAQRAEEERAQKDTAQRAEEEKAWKDTAQRAEEERAQKDTAQEAEGEKAWKDTMQKAEEENVQKGIVQESAEVTRQFADKATKELAGRNIDSESVRRAVDKTVMKAESIPAPQRSVSRLQPVAKAPRMAGRREHTPLYENKWEQLLSTYEQIHPYGDERTYVKLEPKDFIVLRENYQHLVNNSFLLHGFYNYRYLILGREKDFYLGVPGVFYEREKMVALMFGFEAFECQGGDVEEGKFGYYLRKVEL